MYEEWTQKVPQLMNEQSFEECTEDSEHSSSPRKTTFSKDDEQYFIDSSIQKQCSSIQQLHYKEIPMKRYLKNLFVRGDMVVVIYNVDYQWLILLFIDQTKQFVKTLNIHRRSL